MQASRKVRPILEQAAAAAAAAANAEGTAKAQAAAKKAKKLTPEEMKKMRQQADPNYQAQQPAAAGNPAQADGTSKKAKKGKASKPKPSSVSTANQVPASSGTEKLADTNSKPEAAATRAAAQADADQAIASGSKRRQGLGYAEEQPQPKRARQESNSALPGLAASSDTGPAQHDQQAQHGQQSQAASDKQQQTKTKPALQKPAATAQAAVANSGAQGQVQSAAAVTGQGPPVVFTDECTAFVRGLDNKVTEAELRGLLAGCGEIKGVRLVKDKVTGWFKVTIAVSILISCYISIPLLGMRVVLPR